MSDTRSVSTTNSSPGKITSSSTDVSSSIAEQIRQILSTNIVKPNSSTGDTTSLTKTSLDNLSDIVKVENTTIPHTNNNVHEKSQSSFSYPKAEAVSVAVPSFNYTSPSVSTSASVNSFGTTNYSSYNSVNPSMTLNSNLKPSTSLTVPNFVSQSSQFFYPIPAPNIYQSSLNSTAADTTAAILQAYSQFNVQPTTTPSILNQQLSTQQQQIRK